MGLRRGTAVALLAAMAAVLACDRKETTDSSPASPEPRAPAEAEPAETPTKKAPKARRSGPPSGIESSALAAGATAPAMTDLDSTQGPWSRPEAYTIVVFYRGFW